MRRTKKVREEELTKYDGEKRPQISIIFSLMGLQERYAKHSDS